MSVKFYSEGVGRKYLSIKLGHLFYPTTDAESKRARNYSTKITQDSKGNKYENEGLWFTGMETMIHDVRFHDTQYGTNINVHLGDNYVLSDKIDSRTGTMLMDLLPSVDLSKPVYIMPYDFQGTDNKRIRGILMKQDDVKLEPFYFDKEAKAYPKDFPAVPKAPKNGKVSSQAWILYFGNIAMALKERVEEWASSASFVAPASSDFQDDFGGNFGEDVETAAQPDTDAEIDEADKDLPF